MDRITNRKRRNCGKETEGDKIKKGLKRAFFNAVLKVLGETIKERLLRLLAATAVTAAVTQAPIETIAPPPKAPTETKSEQPAQTN